jgi:hypothetical protein
MNLAKGRKIVGVQAQLRRLPSELRQLGSRNMEGFLNFSIKRKGSFFLFEHFGYQFAVLNKRTCSDLQGLSEYNVEYQANLLAREWAEVMRDWESLGLATRFSIELNIYGCRSDAENVGKVLARSEIFLQQPRHEFNNTIYYNPHILRIEGYQEIVQLGTSAPAQADSIDRAGANSVVEIEINDDMAVESILDNLSHHVSLSQMVIDHRIRRDLLEYTAC